MKSIYAKVSSENVIIRIVRKNIIYLQHNLPAEGRIQAKKLFLQQNSIIKTLLFNNYTPRKGDSFSIHLPCFKKKSVMLFLLTQKLS